MTSAGNVSLTSVGTVAGPTLPPRFVATLGDPRGRELLLKLWNWAARTPEPTVEVLRRMGHRYADAQAQVIGWDRSWAGQKVNKAPKPLYEFARFIDVVRSEASDEKKLKILNELIGGSFTPEAYSVVNHFTYNAAFGASSSFLEAGLAGLAYDGMMQGTNDAVDTARSAGVKAGWQTAKYNWKQVVREDLNGARAGSMARRQFRSIQSMEPVPIAAEDKPLVDDTVRQFQRLVKRRDFAALQEEVEKLPTDLRKSVRQRAAEIFESLDGNYDGSTVGIGVNLLYADLPGANLYRPRNLRTIPELMAFKEFAERASKDKNLAFTFESELRRNCGEFPLTNEQALALEMLKGGALADAAYFGFLLRLNSDTLAAKRNLALEFLTRLGSDRRNAMVKAASEINLGTEKSPQPFNLKDAICEARGLTPSARAQMEQLISTALPSIAQR